MSRPGDFNLDGTAGNAADLVYLTSNLDTITPNLNIINIYNNVYLSKCIK